jgi:endonuclease/exonuclease/phosphatase family metal-dependent hydrolase
VRKALKKIVDILNGVAIFGLLLTYVAPYVDPLDFWVITFFGLSYKVWLVINLSLLIFWLILKRKRWIYNAFFMLLGIHFVGRNIQFNSNASTATDIHIASFNTNVQQVYNDGNTSKKIDSLLQAKQLDIVVLIEWLDRKGTIARENFPYQQYVKLEARKNRYNYGLKLVSKYRIVNWDKIKYTHISNNMAAYFDIDIDGEIVRIVAVHLQSNGVSSRDYHKLKKVGLDNEYKEYAFDFLKRLKSPMQRRSEQTKAILQAIANSPYPVIIMGDFNDTPQSFAYQQLRGDRLDAFVEKGNGWGATYLKPFPMLRIDYIMYDSELQCTSYKSTSAVKSDHKLIEATFKLEP